MGIELCIGLMKTNVQFLHRLMLEFMALNLLRLPVIVYKSNPDSTNLGSLGCVMLTVALPQQLLFVRTFFQIALV